MMPDSTLRTTRIVLLIPVGASSGRWLRLGRVPGERGRRAAALVHVSGRAVERGRELVLVLLVRGERAEGDVRAHGGQRARVLRRVARVAGRRAAREVAAVLDDEVDLVGQL